MAAHLSQVQYCVLSSWLTDKTEAEGRRLKNAATESLII